MDRSTNSAVPSLALWARLISKSPTRLSESDAAGRDSVGLPHDVLGNVEHGRIPHQPQQAQPAEDGQRIMQPRQFGGCTPSGKSTILPPSNGGSGSKFKIARFRLNITRNTPARRCPARRTGRRWPRSPPRPTIDRDANRPTATTPESLPSTAAVWPHGWTKQTRSVRPSLSYVHRGKHAPATADSPAGHPARTKSAAPSATRNNQSQSAIAGSTYPPNGTGANKYSVRPHFQPHSSGPKPIENSRDRNSRNPGRYQMPQLVNQDQ